MPRYKLTKASESDFDCLWKYTFETWGIRQANQYLFQLKKCIEMLSENPGIGRNRDCISEGLFSFHEARHLILYRKEDHGIRVIRVLHDKMDVPIIITQTEEEL